ASIWLLAPLSVGTHTIRFTATFEGIGAIDRHTRSPSSLGERVNVATPAAPRARAPRCFRALPPAGGRVPPSCGSGDPRESKALLPGDAIVRRRGRTRALRVVVERERHAPSGSELLHALPVSRHVRGAKEAVGFVEMNTGRHVVALSPADVGEIEMGSSRLVSRIHGGKHCERFGKAHHRLLMVASSQ